MAAAKTSCDPGWARWLQTQLDRLGWERGDLIERAGVSKDRASKWLRGEEIPRIPAIRVVCAALDARAAELGVDRVSAVAGFVAAGHLQPEDVGATVVQMPGPWRPSKREILEELARRIPDDAADGDAPTDLDSRRRNRQPLRPRGELGEDWAANRATKPLATSPKDDHLTQD